LLLVPLGAQNAFATPIEAIIIDVPSCDSVDALLLHELGENNPLFPPTFPVPFPLDELIEASADNGPTVCVPDDAFPDNDWVVTITNLSPLDWHGLYFVVDGSIPLGNMDGFEITNGVPAAAFRIDSVGVNPNLISESIALDGVFQSGETWEFLVTNFGGILFTAPPTPFDSNGLFGITSAGPGVGLASILAEFSTDPRQPPECFTNLDCVAGDGICFAGEFCNPLGQCVRAADPPLSTPCDLDDNLCTLDHCNGAGVCEALSTVVCDDDGDVCNGPESCNPSSGICASGPPPTNEPLCQEIGGEIIPIESTSLILAGAQTFSWMIPIVLSVLGIGLFVVSRKSENS